TGGQGRSPRPRTGKPRRDGVPRLRRGRGDWDETVPRLSGADDAGAPRLDEQDVRRQVQGAAAGIALGAGMGGDRRLFEDGQGRWLEFRLMNGPNSFLTRR